MNTFSRLELVVFFLTTIFMFGCNQKHRAVEKDHSSIKMEIDFDLYGRILKEKGISYQDQNVVFYFIESSCGACNINAREALEAVINCAQSQIPIIVLTNFKRKQSEEVFMSNYDNKVKSLSCKDTIFRYNGYPIVDACFVLLDDNGEVLSWFFPNIENGNSFFEKVSQVVINSNRLGVSFPPLAAKRLSLM